MFPVDDLRKIRKVDELEGIYFSPGAVNWWFRPLKDGSTFVVGIKGNIQTPVGYEELMDFVLDNDIEAVFSDVVYGNVVELFRKHVDGNGVF